MSNNKQTLWIFGDSFACEQNPNYNYQNSSKWTWYKQLQHLLPNCTTGQLRSQFGVSNEWLFSMLRHDHTMIQPNDYVVLVTTEAGRRWFFKNLPHQANIRNATITQLLDKSQHKAVKSYITHLTDNPILDECYHETLIGWAAHLSAVCNFKLCVIPAFETTPLHSAFGSLNGVCNGEFVDHKLRDYFYSVSLWDDRRICHMTKSNHTVLAQKIADHYATGEIINLDDGFVKHIYKTKDDADNFDPCL